MNSSFKHYILAFVILTSDVVNSQEHYRPRAAGVTKILPTSSDDDKAHGIDQANPEQHILPSRRKLQNSLRVADLNTLTPGDLVQNILGSDVTSSNVIYTGANIASGTFTGGTGIIGFEAGIVLTSGSASNIIGPNTDDGITMDNRLQGDSDLDVIIPNYKTYDASALEFDFECSGVDNIYFEYIFASDEYNEYVDSAFNDVFGFFLNGANVALVPGTTTPVSINSVNCGNRYSSSGPNCDKFNNNDLSDGGPFFNTEMDGFTHVLIVNASVNDGLNHIKLAIADVDDTYVDSAVLIKAGSFSCVVPVIGGDPHIKTWSNKQYDFHGVCDLVLLKNPGFEEGLGMDIHVRTKQVKQFSYVSSVALRIGGDILEVMGALHDNLFWINKKANRNVDNGIIGSISGYPISYQRVKPKQHTFILNIGVEKSIIIMTYKTFVRVSIHGATEESFGTSLGLLGSYGSGKMISRDNITAIEDTNEFGQEWQVLPSDGMLFHNLEGPQAPEKCQLPLASNLRRRLTQFNINQEEAELACASVGPSSFDMCVFDVIATGDKDVVRAY